VVVASGGPSTPTGQARRTPRAGTQTHAAPRQESGITFQLPDSTKAPADHMARVLPSCRGWHRIGRRAHLRGDATPLSSHAGRSFTCPLAAERTTATKASALHETATKP
jgi:hypothetical protein